MATFSKRLSPTDIRKRLALPTKYLTSLPSFNGGHAVDFQAMDGKGKVWNFKCSIRRKGKYLKPVLSRGWLSFVASKKLKVGDKVTFYKENNNATHAMRIHEEQAEKEIKVFGAIFGYAPIVIPSTGLD